MRIIIVEDRPWKLRKSIIQIREMGIEVNCLIYVQNESEIKDAAAAAVEQMANELGLTVVTVNLNEFDSVMDKYYLDQNNYFFIDLDLQLGIKLRYFDERISVQYAKKLLRNKQDLKRIWFYTTSGENSLEQINFNFPGRNISVDYMQDDQVMLDFDEIKKVLAQVNSASVI